MTENHFTAGLVIDINTGEVSNTKTKLRLSPVNTRVIAVLLENAGQAVSRQQIFDAVWPNQVISDDALTRSISDLRAQLKPMTATEPLIETIPKVGYRWLPELVTETDAVGVSLVETDVVKTKKIEAEQSIWQKQLKPALMAFLLLLVLLWGFFSLLSFWSKTSAMPLVILPTNSTLEDPLKNTGSHDSEITNCLKQAVLNHENMQYLSAYAMKSHSGNPFPFYSHEFGVRWFIESQLIQTDKQKQLILNLIDAKTALVIYSQQHDYLTTEELTVHCQQYIDFIGQL